MSNIAWVDLTVEDAAPVRDFYAGVMGWQPEAVDMGDYSDYNMLDPESGESTAGAPCALVEVGGDAGTDDES